MSFIWSETIDLILSGGVSLDHLGGRNWALGRDDALHAIYELETIEAAILGGDVYQLVGEKAQQTYNSWYCDQDPAESDSAFSKRSSDKARSYINSYLIHEVLFAIKPKV